MSRFFSFFCLVCFIADRQDNIAQKNSLLSLSSNYRLFSLLILLITMLFVNHSSFAAITFRAASSNGIASIGGLAINIPAGTVSGDVLIASIAWRRNSPAIAAPAGWTLVRETLQPNGGGASNRFASYLRVVDGSEPTSYTWSFSGGIFSGAVGGISAFSGVDTANPIDVEGGNTTANSFNHTANSITTTLADSMIVSAHEFPSATSNWTAPAGMTEIVDAASIPRPNTVGIALSINYVLQAATGATGNKTAAAATGGTDAGYGAAHILALRPDLGSICTDTFRDDFSNTAFSNNNGTLNWSGDWQEYDSKGAGPVNGYASISGGELILNNYSPEVNTRPGVMRELDLSGYTSATLTLDFRTIGVVDNDDRIEVEISSNGGTSWTALEVITNINDGSYSRSYDITAFISNNTQISMRVSDQINNGSCCYGGVGEEVHIDFIEVSASKSCSSIDHYLINHDNFAINCVTETITVTALDSSNMLVDAGSGMITINTQSGRGNWSVVTGSGAFANGVADDGTATYTFASGESSVQFGLDYQQGSSPISIAVSDGTASDDGTHGVLPFNPNGFTVTSTLLGNPPVIPNPSFNNQIAGSDFPIYISAYGVTPSDPVCGVIEAYQGQKTLQFWSGYNNPGSGITRVAISDDNDTGLIGTTEGSATARSVTFTQGQALVTGKYKDVGRITISMKDVSTADPDIPNGIRGSAQFIVRPNHFAIHSIQCSDATNNPAAGNQNGARFCPAGEPFSVTIDARDADDDVTPNYGQESAAEDVQLTATLIAPAGENNPAIVVQTADPFNAGASSPQLSWSEVGIISLTPAVADSDYLGAGNVSGTSSGNIGRFYPFDFNISLDNSPELAHACSGFTYIGQDIFYSIAPLITITARPSDGSSNALTGGVTQNYDGVWWKLADFTETVSQDSANPLPAGVTLDSSAAWHSAINCTTGTCNGSFTTQFNGQFLYTRNVAETAPFNGIIDISFSIDDGDAQYASNPYVINDLSFSGISNQQRSGRITVFDAYGSELYQLNLPVTVQYWEDVGSGDFTFITSGDDNCSTLSNTDVNLSNYTGNLSSGETLVSATALANGAGTITLSAPGDGNEGGVDATVDQTPAGANQPWLQFDWDDDNALDDNPDCHARFGIFPGNSRQIYMREQY